MRNKRTGFTLIELSIVLIIIGLIIGGVLVGQDMIKSAEIRATLQQIEKYNTAVNTFRAKYGGIPGDLLSTKAASFGMETRAGTDGSGDGDGLIESCGGGSNGELGGCENLLFWRDLSFANLTEGSFATAIDDFVPAPLDNSTIPLYFPAAKIGRSNYVVAYTSTDGAADGINHFEIAGVLGLDTDGTWNLFRRITPQEASTMDGKVDDALPTTGTVLAVYAFGSLGYLDLAAAPANGVCVSNAAGNPYNTTTSDYANSPSCQLSFRFN